MASRKRIRLACHGVLSAGPQYKTPWEDIWMQWKGKPGRRTYYAAPMLGCAAELRGDIEISMEAAIRHPDLKANFEQDIAVDMALLKDLETQEFTDDSRFYPGHDRPALANVYVEADGIDRALATRMLEFYLAKYYQVRNPKLKWPKKDFVVLPFSHGVY